MGEAARGHHDRRRAHLDAVRDRADHTPVLEQQVLDPRVQDDLHTSLPAGGGQDAHQPVPLVLGHVAPPDVLHPGPGQTGRVGVGGEHGGELDAEPDEPFERRTAPPTERLDQPGLQHPLVEVHVVLVEAFGGVLDAERRLHTGARRGEQAGRQLRRSAEFGLGLEQQDPGTPFGRARRSRQPGTAATDHDHVVLVGLRHGATPRPRRCCDRSRICCCRRAGRAAPPRPPRASPPGAAAPGPWRPRGLRDRPGASGSSRCR